MALTFISLTENIIIGVFPYSFLLDYLGATLVIKASVSLMIMKTKTHLLLVFTSQKIDNNLTEQC